MTAEHEESLKNSILKGNPGLSVYFSWDLLKTQTKLVNGGYKYWLTKCCLYVETMDKKGKKFIHGTEVASNAFHWKEVKLEGASLQEYNDFSFMKLKKSFTVEKDDRRLF